MFRLTIMGASEIRLEDDSNVIITIMGGTSVLLPTIAERIRRLKRQQSQWNAHVSSRERRTTIVTLMGGTVFQRPTIAREIEEMINLRHSGLVSEGELLHLWRQALQEEDRHLIDAYTVMGATHDEDPSTNDEIKALRQIAARGLISVEECEQLSDLLRGKPGSHVRYHLLQQRLGAFLSPPMAARSYQTNSLETGRLTNPQPEQMG